MLHHIIAKYNDSVTDKTALFEEIRSLFEPAVQLPGVHGVTIKPNVIDRSNRYDIMIIINMDEEALTLWDASELHHRWKETYGPVLEKKAIFDSAD